MKTSLKGIGMTSGAGIIFGAFPIFTSLFVRFGGDVDTFNLYGFLLSVVFLASFIVLTKRSFRLPKTAVCFIILAGLMNVVTRILLTYSYEYLDVGIATTLHFLYPLFAALLGSVCFREKMPFYKWIAFVIASCSVSLFATGFSSGGQFVGIVLAVSSAVCFALYMLITEKAGLTEMDPVVFVFYVSLVSAIGCVGMGTGGAGFSGGAGYGRSQRHPGGRHPHEGIDHSAAVRHFEQCGGLCPAAAGCQISGRCHDGPVQPVRACFQLCLRCDFPAAGHGRPLGSGYFHYPAVSDCHCGAG